MTSTIEKAQGKSTIKKSPAKPKIESQSDPTKAIKKIDKIRAVKTPPLPSSEEMDRVRDTMTMVQVRQLREIRDAKIPVKDVGMDGRTLRALTLRRLVTVNDKTGDVSVTKLGETILSL